MSPGTLEYLKARGLHDESLINHFKLGFSNRTLGLRLPHANRVEGRIIRERLQHLGVLREASGHEHLNGSLVIPIHDEAGAVVGMYGRKVNAKSHPSTNHLYLPGPHRAAFNSAALAHAGGTAIVCEALIDALSFWAAGFRNVIAAYGVEGFTSHHLEALKRHQVRHVVIAFDRDDAGDAGAEALAKQLQAENFDCYRALFPRGLDANVYACRVTPASKALGVVLRHASFMGKGAPRGTPHFSSLVAQPPPPVVPPPVAKQPTRVDPPAQPQLAPPNAAPTPPTSGSKERKSETPPLTARVPTLDAVTDAVPGLGAAVAAPLVPADTPLPPMASNLAASSSSITSDDEAIFNFGLRRYRLRGLSKPHTPDSLRINILLSVGDSFHVDTFDLYSAKARTAFVLAAAGECRVDSDVVKRDVGQLLLQLETLLDKRREEAKGPKVPLLSSEEREEALALLRTPDLLQRVLDDFTRCGVVGEETNKLVGYLAAVSRKLEEPLAVLIQSSSAAGKSSLMEAVLAFVPEEEKTKYSAMTGQSLFYMGDVSLRHKVLAVVEEEGASRASYALKLLQSEGELTIASTGKDPHTGRLVTHEYRVEGPTQLFLTTTASELDEELLNRCVVLTVDEDAAQTKAIHQQQRERQTLEGMLQRRDKETLLKVHQNAQRLLRPLAVTNPFARQLTFLDDRTRARRDFPKYLTLIRAVTLLHQYQRPVKTTQHHGQPIDYLEVTAADIECANRLAAAIFGRSLDELPPQTRRLLSQLEAYVACRAEQEDVPRGEVRFTRRQLREALKWGDTQLHLHLSRLERLEYLSGLRGLRGGFSYQLMPAAGALPSTGLIDATALDAMRTTTQDSGVEVRIRGAFGVHSGVGAEASTSSPLSTFAAAQSAFGGAANSHSRVLLNAVVPVRPEETP